MLQEDMSELTKSKYFNRVVSLALHKQIVKLQWAHTSWDFFQRALLKEFEDEDMTTTSR